jgi:Ca2+-binding RTX toxin-like protein
VILGDSSHSVLNDWRVKFEPNESDTPASGVVVVDTHYEINGNYCDKLGNIYWNEEKMFTAAKLVVEMEYQHTAVDQYARSITPDLPEFVGYNSGENATVSLEYAQAAFRFGHSTMRETIDIMDPNGSITGKVMSVALEQAFLNPSLYASKGAAAIAMGMTHQQMGEIDEILTPAMNQGLLGQPLDLAAINIARGRDIGLPTLNDFREAVGLHAYKNWADFGNNMIHPESLVNFIAAYSFDGDVAKAKAIVGLDAGDIEEGSDAAQGFTLAEAIDFLGGADDGYNHIDTWIGGLAEAHVMGGLLGETFNLVFLDQIQRLMDGDRFYYLYRLNNMNLGDEIANAQFKDIIERNTGLQHLNGSAFAYADQYYDLSAAVDPLNSTANVSDTDNITALNAYKSDHKYAAQLDAYASAHAGNHIGISSIGGAGYTGNGEVIHIGGVGGQDYIRDVRTTHTFGNPNASPDGLALDGTPQTGANSNEVLIGTDYNDILDMGGGDDTAYGEGGNDIIYGGAGIDRLYGGAGNGTIYGGDSGDLIDGGDGDDILYGDSSGDAAAQVDQIIGGAGNDIIFGGAGIDKLSGGSGDDVIFGGANTDAFTHGGDGNDYLDGQTDGDLLWGDDGDDLIVGGNNQDIVAGLDGDDILRPGNPSSAGGGGPDEVLGGDGVSDAGNGGKGVGFDLIDFSDYFASAIGVTADMTTQANPAGAINLNSSFPAWVGIEGVIGSRNDDTELGDDGNNWLIGGSGNDLLRGGAGFDLIIGDGVRLDSLIGTYGSGYGNTFDEASHRAVGFIGVDARNDAGTTNINHGVNGHDGLLDQVQASGFDKHFTEMLKSAMFQNLELGGSQIKALQVNGQDIVDTSIGDGGTVGANDTAVYVGRRAEYIIDHFDYTDASGHILNVTRVHDTIENRDGDDLLVGIEKLNFSDVTGVDINAVNHSPTGVANAVLAAGTEDVTYTVTKAALLVGITDADGDVLDIVGLPTGLNATVTLGAAPGTYNIVMPANFHGAIALSYTVIDGQGGSLAATQNFNVTSVNDLTIGTVNISTAGGAAPELLSVLTAGNPVALTDVDGPITLLGYEWQSSSNGGATWATIVGSGNTNTYTTQAADAGKQIRVVQSYNTGIEFGTETLTSVPTTAIANYVTLTGTPGIDTLTATTSLNYRILGLASNDILVGNSGNDILDGGTGADTMTGGAGNDIYVVDNSGDTVVEVAGTTGTAAQKAAANGIDTIESSITYSLAALGNIEKLTLTGAAALNATGNGLANTLTGNSGNNILDGGTGADIMIGGLGSDTYIVDNAGDSVVEGADATVGNADLVNSSVSFSLGANIENLTLTGTSAGRVAVGNSLDNIITGSSAVDTLMGGDGNDLYYVTAGDTVFETAGQGTDTVSSAATHVLAANVENLILTGTSNINGTGNDLDNNITGNNGNNTLNAGTDGIDTLSGGLGNDTYIVDHTGVTVTEVASANVGGADLVQSSVTYTITNVNIENLELTGGAAINGTGNSAVNTVTGNGNDNTLNGGGGADTLIGGDGNDTYIVGNAGVTIVETSGSGSGTDTVQASVTTTLSANVENLTLTGTTAISGTGNTSDNVITGNAAANTLTGDDGNDTLNGLGGNDILVGGAGADILNGGAGKDTLTGGTGNDVFVFGQTGIVLDTVNGANRDIITDFTIGDKIDLRGIDANTGAVDLQGFDYTGILTPGGTIALPGSIATTFSAAGQLRYYFSGADTIIEGNLNATTASEFQIQLSGIHYALGAADFVL